MAHGPDTERMLYRINELVKHPYKKTCYLNLMNLDITSLPKLPHGITHLNCNNTDIGLIKQLPSTLVSLLCTGSGLREICALPPFLKELRCDNNPGLRLLPDLPDSLDYLDCANCNLRELPLLPPNLTRLFCCYNPPLKSLPTLPNRLLELDTTGIILQNLPPALTYLKTNMSVDADLPESLRFLVCLEGTFYIKDQVTKYNQDGDVIRSKRRCLERTALIKPDLIAALWDPQRIFIGINKGCKARG